MTDLNLDKKFESMLNDEHITEQSVQNFIEDNTKLFYPPFELNHGISSHQIISKFKLDTTLVTDFAYLTKSSAVWWFVLVELEHPSKKIFTGKGATSAEFNKAKHQVTTWRTFVKRNANEVIRKIDPLRKPLVENKVLFKYVLVIGRTAEFQGDQVKVDAFEELQGDDFRVLTYDSLIHAYQKRPNELLDVISQKGGKFSFKRRHRDDVNIFAWLTPNDFDLGAKDITYYKSHGYDIDSWLAGNFLFRNGRKAK